MPRNVAVLFVHGIHANDFEFATPMRELLVNALPRNLRPYVRWRSIFWADVVRGRSYGYLYQAITTAKIVDNQYRRLVVEGLGDAAAYQKTRNRENSAYFQIQHRITQTLKEIDSAEDPSRPLVFIGHSLGCHIISSYAWDTSRLAQMSDEEVARWDDAAVLELVSELRQCTPFCRLGTFAGFITIGTNMPLFTFTFGPDRVFPITRSRDAGLSPAFPGAALSPRQLAKARWLNFYSRNEILGYPLKPLNTAYYEEERLTDIEVYSEGYLRAKLLPPVINATRAHLGYWTNPTVVHRSAELIADIISAEDDPPRSWYLRKSDWIRGLSGR